jgi:hypothetical protein
MIHIKRLFTPIRLLCAILMALSCQPKAISQTLMDDESGLIFTVENESFCYVSGYSFQQPCVSIPPIIYNGGIPYSVQSIRYGAFAGYNQLDYLIIPSSVEYIEDSAFQGCYNINYIKLESEYLPGLIGNVFESEVYQRAAVHIPDSDTARGFVQISGWGQFQHIYCGDTLLSDANSATTIATDIYDDAGFKFDIYDNGTAKVTGYTSSSATELEIPSSISYEGCNYEVTAIGSEAFAYFYSLLSVTFPNSITSIGSEAFRCCFKLKDVTFPENLTTIGSEAFYSCQAMETIIIPDNVTSIGESAFYDCGSYATLILGKSLQTIGNNAFGSERFSYIISKATTAPQLASDNVFYSETYYYDGATVYIPDSDEAEESYKSYDNYWYQFHNIVRGIPNTGDGDGEDNASVNQIGSYTLSDISYNIYDNGTCEVASYSGSESFLYIPDSINYDGADYTVTAIGREALAYAYNLQTIRLPDAITTIGDYAFQNCYGLQFLELPDAVTSIGESAFEYCSALLDITLGANLQSIGANAFTYATSLNRITSRAATAPTMSSSDTFSQQTYDTVILNIPDSDDAYNSYSTATGWSQFNTIRRSIAVNADGSIINQIGYYQDPSNEVSYYIYDNGTCAVASYYGDATSLEIPAGITYEGTDYTVTALGNGAFSGRTELESISLPSTITTIDSWAFQSCYALESIDLPSGVKFIGEGAFNLCKALKSIVFPDNLTSLGETVFANCTSLQTVTLGSGLQNMGSYPFVSDEAITTVISKATTAPTAPAGIFDSSVYSTAILYIPDSDESYESYTTSLYWMSFKNIVRGIPEIDDTAGGYEEATFYDEPSCLWYHSSTDGTCEVIRTSTCYDLTNVEIPVTVTYNDLDYRVASIAAETFKRCSILQTLTINMGPEGETINDSAFTRCSNLTTITFKEVTAESSDESNNDANQVKRRATESGAVTLGDQVFTGCSSLTTIFIDAATLPIASSTTFDDSHYTQTQLLYHSDMTDAITTTDVWKEFKQQTTVAGIDKVSDDNASVTSEDRSIIVNGFEGEISVYNISGQKVYQGHDSRIAISNPGLYIVIINNQPYKVAVRF